MRMGFLADKVTGTAKKVLQIVIELLIIAFAGIVIVIYRILNIIDLIQGKGLDHEESERGE